MIPIQCCAPCPTVEVTNIPGSEGSPGTDGAAGLNAFTITTADFTVPNIGASVTILVADSTWSQIGQNIFIPGAGNFSVTNKVSASSMTLQYLNYAGNTNFGMSVVAGAGVSPSGTQPAVTLLPAISGYAVGGSQALTNSSVKLLTPSLTLAAKTYLILATYRIDYNIATFVAPEAVSLKLRETTNGPADIANAVVGLESEVVTTHTGTFVQGSFPTVTYVAAAGDTIQMFGSIAVTPYSGSLAVVEVAIVATPLF